MSQQRTIMTPLDSVGRDGSNEMKQLLQSHMSAKKAPFQSSVSPSTTVVSQSTRVKSSDSGPDIFISLRFGEALAAGKSLQQKLVAKGFNVFLCAVQAGGDLMTEIVYNIDKAKLVVIMGTKTYGQKTDAAFSTHEELKFLVNENKERFLVKMCDRFEDALARFHLGSNISYHLWMPRSEAEQRSVPADLVEAIVAKYQSL
eukprot:m.83028 g.83028  ORF g.83028 m.83028 type:complete len:201 (+) comp14327_c0_seq4:464-1066(+)